MLLLVSAAVDVTRLVNDAVGDGCAVAAGDRGLADAGHQAAIANLHDEGWADGFLQAAARRQRIGEFGQGVAQHPNFAAIPGIEDGEGDAFGQLTQGALAGHVERECHFEAVVGVTKHAEAGLAEVRVEHRHGVKRRGHPVINRPQI